MKFIYTTVLAGALGTASAWANYNDDCMRALLVEKAPSREVDLHKYEWISAFPQLGVDRDVSDLEYEVLLDLMSGLGIYAEHGNGKQSLLLLEAADLAKTLKIIFRRDTIVGARFTEAAAKKVSQVLRQACETLQLVGCQVYEMYPGLINSDPRPLTRRQEQMVKWATLHGAFQPSFLAELRILPQRERAAFIAKGLEGKVLSARDLIYWAFEPAEAKKLLDEYIFPYLIASLEAASRVAVGERSH